MKAIKILLNTTVLIFIFSFSAFSQLDHVWQRIYDPVSPNSQAANDVAAGDDGAAYVLGYHSRGYNGTDVALVKYNSNGVLNWVRSYDGGNVNNADIGKSVSTFKSGSNIFIYAACDISTSGIGNTAGLLKYDSSGSLIWSKNINTGLNSYVNKITIDISGFIYLTGSTSYEAFVIKFNSNGDTLWMKKHPVPAGYYNASGNDITVDSSGNVYITGHHQGPSTYFEMITFKYNSAGVLQWSKVYDNGNFYDAGNAITFSNGFVYVTGRSDAAGQSDIITIKYKASNGDSIKVKRYNGALNQFDNGRDIEVDSQANIYITGQTNGINSSGDIITIKYDSSGILKWNRTYGGSAGTEDAGKKIALDGSGNIFIAGRINFGAGASFIGIKYNSIGDSLWTRIYDCGLYEEVFSMTLDKNYNMLITGECDNIDMPLVKYNSSGQLQWMRKFYGAQLISDQINCTAADKNGNVYVAGRSRVSQFGDQFTLIKYNSSGTQMWVRSYGVQLFDGYDEAKAMVIDNSGFIYVTGTSYSKFNNESNDYLTFKIDTAGNQQWYATFNGIGNSGDDAKAIAVDNNGNVYVTGESMSSNLDYCTVKYNSSGSKLWERYYNGTGNGADYAYDITTDNSGNIYVTGQSSGGASSDDAATLKYNSSGTLLWEKRFNGSANGFDYCNTVKVDLGGNVYVCGMAKENSNGYNLLLLKYKPDGNLRWMKQVNGTDSANQYEFASSIKLDSAGRFIYLGGSWTDPYYNGKCHFFAKYDSSGLQLHKINAFYGIGNGDAYGSDIVLDKYENFIIPIYRVYNNGSTDILLSSYDSSGNPINVNFSLILPNTSISPNGKNIIALSGQNVFLGGCTYDSTKGRLMSVNKYILHNLKLRIEMFIQGFYVGSNQQIEDTITLQIRNSNAPYAIADSSKAVVKFWGFLETGFDNAAFGSYYVVLKHRNSIETWSALPVNFSTTGVAHLGFAYDSSVAYGSNQIKVSDIPPNRYAIYSGDANQDGNIDVSDIIDIYNDMNNVVSGYVSTDINGDDFVDVSDLLITYNNSVNVVSKITP